MNETLRLILTSYLENDELDIDSISFLKGGNISKDSLSIQYYRKINGRWTLNTDQIQPTGEIKTRMVEVSR